MPKLQGAPFIHEPCVCGGEIRVWNRNPSYVAAAIARHGHTEVHRDWVAAGRRYPAPEPPGLDPYEAQISTSYPPYPRSFPQRGLKIVDNIGGQAPSAVLDSEAPWGTYGGAIPQSVHPLEEAPPNRVSRASEERPAKVALTR